MILKLRRYSRGIASFFLVLLLATNSHAGESLKPVRVLVAENQEMVKINVSDDYLIRVIPSMQIVKKGRGLKNAWLVPTATGIRIGKEEWACRGVRIEPQKDRDIVMNRSRFRGSLHVLKDLKKTLFCVNVLPLESYLYGVLHYEVSSWWPMEALKAQAVAARTYAYHETLTSRSIDYDLKNNTSSQVFGGSTVERYRTKRAVNLTAGEVLTFQKKIFPAYFHATCAGFTASAAELWKIDLPPIAGGVECNFCRISPDYNWEARMSLTEAEEKMKKYGRPVGQVLSIEIITQTPSHRVGSLRITGTQGETVVAAKDFRVWIGGSRIRSTAFSVEIREDTVYFYGRGWGHGVGLCQWGTLGQAIAGKKYKEILSFYYPQSQIEDIR